jgi:hypothetical protein
MRQRTMWLSSLGLGAATAFLVDPASGNRRRRRIGDAVVHLTHGARDTASSVGRDLRNRTQGIMASTRRRMRREHADDGVIEDRVRTVMGRILSHPHAITVKAQGGRVILDGPIVAAEEHGLVNAVRAVAGVKHVETRFDRHIQPAGVPALQGEPPALRTPPGPDILQPHWAPATRAIVASSGAALVGVGAIRRDRNGLALAATGAALVARAATNQPFRRLVGISAARRTIGA